VRRPKIWYSPYLTQKTMKILVHYIAFDSNQVFEYNGGVGGAGLSRENLLEVIWRQCNVVDGTEWIVGESKRRIKTGQKGLRSMSVGDIVTFVSDSGSWESYLCAGMGWEKIGGEK
jgi:hypothetical protein